MKGLKQLSVLLGMAALATPAWAVITVTVDDVPGNNVAYVNGTGGNLSGASAVKDAVAAVNADPTADSVEINIVDTDGAADVYVGDFTLQKANTTIRQMANGGGNDVAVVLQGDGTRGGAPAYHFDAAGCSLRGLSATKRLGVKTNGTGASNIITGISDNAVDMAWEFVDWQPAGNEALDHNDFTTGNIAGNETFDGCRFSTGNGPQFFVDGVTFNDCLFDGGGFLCVMLDGSAVANRCTFTASAGGIHMGGAASSFITNDCSFATGAPIIGAFSGGPLDDGDVFEMNRPTFAGPTGHIALWMAADATVTVRGEPGNLVDFAPLSAGGGAIGGTNLIGRINKGTLNLEYCTNTGVFPAGNFDSHTGVTDGDWNDLIGNVTINMNNCYWIDGGGRYGANTGGGAYSVVINATNTIWTGTSPLGDEINLNGQASGHHTGASFINLLHCTMLSGTGNAYFFGDGNRGDEVRIDGSIINPNRISGSHVLSSIGQVQGFTPHIPNVTYVNVADDGTGNPFEGNPLNGATDGTPAMPGDIVADPQVDATGHIINPQSTTLVAPGGATGSTVAIDFDGEPRPNPVGSVRDIGADETFAIPVTISDFSME